MVVLRGVAVSYERGTPAGAAPEASLGATWAWDLTSSCLLAAGGEGGSASGSSNSSASGSSSGGGAELEARQVCLARVDWFIDALPLAFLLRVFSAVQRLPSRRCGLIRTSVEPGLTATRSPLSHLSLYLSLPLSAVPGSTRRRLLCVQGYLAHKKQHPPLGPP